MLRTLKKNKKTARRGPLFTINYSLFTRKGQAIMGEYMLVIFVAVGTIVAMTVYFKRAWQARVFDARNYMLEEVRARTAGEFSGNLYKAYEPYYTNTVARVSRDSYQRENTQPSYGVSSGIFIKDYDEGQTVEVISEVMPPRHYNRVFE